MGTDWVIADVDNRGTGYYTGVDGGIGELPKAKPTFVPPAGSPIKKPVSRPPPVSTLIAPRAHVEAARKATEGPSIVIPGGAALAVIGLGVALLAVGVYLERKR